MARTCTPVFHCSRLVAASVLGLAALASCAQAPAPVVVSAVATSGKAAKRAGPGKVAPVRIGDTVYEAVHWGLTRGLAHNGGYVRALDAATGREAWVLEVYRVDDDPRRERDVQDVFIDTLRAGPAGRTLEVGDEEGRRFEIDLQARTVRPL